MLRRTPMKRTAWQHKPLAKVTAHEENVQNQAAPPMECAPVAIKKIVKSTAKMAQKADFTTTICAKAPPPFRSNAYRRLVASLECYHCRIYGHSQAAHPNTRKTKGVKACDRLIFPMCTVSGKDCHGRFDLYRLVPRAEMEAFEEAALSWTIETLQARGMWPKGMAVPDLTQGEKT